MACYKIEKDSIARFKNFDTLELAQAYADTLGVGFVATLENVQDFPPFTRTLADDMRFSKDLYDSFVQGNRDAEITPTESQELITLGTLKALVDAGAVLEMIGFLQSLVTPLARVYTTARRDLDVLKIQSYIDSL
jgi:hypothetical protein